MPEEFDTRLSDSQATPAEPVKPRDFDFDRYEAYASELDERCAAFLQQESGVLVYRRMRVADCFSSGCRDMERSLALQLGALRQSMDYAADVPNFLEPWYGIGTVAGAYGGDYLWKEGQAPVLPCRFSGLEELLASEPCEVAESPIGRHTLEMISYFMEQTRGRLPVSFTDSQSPLNMAGHLLPLDRFFVDMIMDPEKVLQLFDRLAGLSLRFNREQELLVGSSLALPGHGFASSRRWRGLGMSDDNALMISPEQYTTLAVPSVEKTCAPLGGPAFHSCGDWSEWTEAVLSIRNLVMADGAFSPRTDPGATTRPEHFRCFAGTGVILNARIVGTPDTIRETVGRLWTPGLKLVVVTYCQTPAEQEKVYHIIHELCR